MMFRAIVVCWMMCLYPVVLSAEDTVRLASKGGHRLELAVNPAYIFSTHPFLQGENLRGKLIRGAVSGHLKYSFQFSPGKRADKLYGGAYQGIGLACFSFGEPDELGNPVALYIFQGARIARLNSFLS